MSKMKSSVFSLSQRAHQRLNRKHHAVNTAKSKALGNYHGEVYATQQSIGKILPKSERKKIFKFWIDYETRRKK